MMPVQSQLFLVGVLLILLLDLPGISSLTADEISAFGARTYIDSNTGLQGSITITEYDDDNYVIEANGIPDHDAGPYPNDEDSSEIVEQTYVYYIPKTPSAASETTELPMGAIGLALNGVPVFNPYSATGGDAVEEELFDDCDGHPTPENGAYHYHDMPSCVFDFESGVASEIVGVALDGYPIYGPNDENGNELVSDDLDECHGRTVNGNYQYHITQDFPYIMGCYHGEVDDRNSNTNSGMPPPPNQNGGDGDGDGGAIGLAGNMYLSLLTVISTLLFIFPH